MLFLCDAMLGGLARWLRAAGYDAEFEHGIDDAELVARAGAKGAVLLSSDAPLFDRGPLRSAAVRGLFVPRHRPALEQAAFVLRAFGLPIRDARCMACGGALLPVEKHRVAAEVPPRALASHDAFFRCDRCARVYWHGTHWAKIDRERAGLAAQLEKSLVR